MNIPTHPTGAASSAEYLPLYRPAIRVGGAAFAVYLALTLILCFPLLRAHSTAVLGDTGGLLDLRLLEEHVRGLAVSPWFDTRFGYPFGETLAWGNNFILPSAILAPLISGGVSLTGALVLLVLIATVANGWCSFRLIYQVTGTTSAAILGGIAFIATPMLWGAAAAPSFACAFFIPLVLSASLRIVAQRSISAGFELGIVLSAAFYTSLDYTVSALGAAVLTLVGFIVLHPHRWSFRSISAPALGVVLGALPGLCALPPYLRAGRILEPIAPATIDAHTATLTSFTPASPFSNLLTTGFSPHLGELSCGWIVAIAAVLAIRRLADTRSLCLLLLLGLIFVGGSAALTPRSGSLLPPILGGGGIVLFGALVARLGWLERKLGVQIATNRGLIGVFLTVGALFFLFALGAFSGVFAGLANVLSLESPARSSIVVALALPLLASFTAARVFRHRGRILVLAPILGLLVIVENYRPARLTTVPALTNIDRFLAAHAHEPAAVVSLPLNTGTPHGEPLPLAAPAASLSSVNSATTRASVFLTTLARETADFPSARSIRSLAAVSGLRYIVVADGRAPHGSIIAAAGRFADSIKYLESDGAGRHLFELIAETRIRDDFILRVPPRPRGVVRAELTAVYQPNEPHVPITLLRNNGGNWESISHATLTANGRWQEYSFPLPPGDGTALPLEIRFEVPRDARVSIRKTGFTPLK